MNLEATRQNNCACMDFNGATEIRNNYNSGIKYGLQHIPRVILSKMLGHNNFGVKKYFARSSANE